MVSLVDFLISLAILLGLMVWYRFVPDWRILFAAAVFLVAGLAAALGCGFWFSALNVKYRDFRYIVPFIVQFGLYVSPVGFSSVVIPGALAPALFAQPHGRRHRRLPLVALRRARPSSTWPGFALSLVLVCCWCSLGGLGYFRRTERPFADVI